MIFLKVAFFQKVRWKTNRLFWKKATFRQDWYITANLEKKLWNRRGFRACLLIKFIIQRNYFRNSDWRNQMPSEFLKNSAVVCSSDAIFTPKSSWLHLLSSYLFCNTKIGNFLWNDRSENRSMYIILKILPSPQWAIQFMQHHSLVLSGFDIKPSVLSLFIWSEAHSLYTYVSNFLEACGGIPS